MTEQQHANRIFTLAADLTAAMNDAEKDGLHVELPVWHEMGLTTDDGPPHRKRLLVNVLVAVPIEPEVETGGS